MFYELQEEAFGARDSWFRVLPIMARHIAHATSALCFRASSTNTTDIPSLTDLHYSEQPTTAQKLYLIIGATASETAGLYPSTAADLALLDTPHAQQLIIDYVTAQRQANSPHCHSITHNVHNGVGLGYSHWGRFFQAAARSSR